MCAFCVGVDGWMDMRARVCVCPMMCRQLDMTRHIPSTACVTHDVYDVIYTACVTHDVYDVISTVYYIDHKNKKKTHTQIDRARRVYRFISIHPRSPMDF